MTQYLKQRGNIWWYSRKYPKHLQHELGVFHRVSLRTKDVDVARKRRDLEHANFHAMVAKAEREENQSPVVAMAKHLLEVKSPFRDGPGHYTEEDVLWELLEDWIRKNDPQKKNPATQAALKIAGAPENTPLLDTLITEYENELSRELTKQTVAERMGYIHRWAEWVGESTPVSAVLDPDDAFRFAKETIIDTDLAMVTKRKRLNSLVMFFKWLISRRVVGSNPFAGIELVSVKGRKGGAEGKRRAWSDVELQQLLSGLQHAAAEGRMGSSRRNAQKLHSMVLIGMYSGLRIDEITSLKTEDCRDGVFTVREGKTRAAVRQVPIHPEIKELVDHLVEESTDGWLIPELTPGGPDGKRSWHIQKAFGRLKKAMGFPPELVFHSLRKTFITKMHQAGVPVMIAKSVVGHQLNDLTFGHYSQGQLVETLREAVRRVGYFQ